jgi:hypothetical protein
MAGVPHEVVGDELPTPLERFEKCRRALRANQRCSAVHLDHMEPPASCRNGVTFMRVSLLSNPQCVELLQKGAPIDDIGRC